ncbi:oxygenase MpaB family protein [Streptomyces pristinaespiralis]|uniref:oxygenase MpaB family protein n=1 Tax=Streptomyces pristinaespiralis TaxID=38300 RepID=UPI0033FC7A76
MGRYSRLREIRRMDPAKDYERIHRSIALYEFPWDYTQGLGIAFLRDYGVPRISELLDRTQEFERAGQKRYDDTLLFGYEIAENGFESERGRAAGRHLNRIHARYRIPNEDFLYVLATTVVGPKRWIDAFGWRRLCPNETEALALVGHRMALMMGISGAPSTYDGFEKLLDGYEREMFAYAPANRRVASATLRVMAGWYPRSLRPLVTRLLLALLDEPLSRALGFPIQPAWVRAAARRALRCRALVVRLLPARPRWRPARPRPRSYPFGWTLDDLGPHWAAGRPLEPLHDEHQGRHRSSDEQRTGGRTGGDGSYRASSGRK